MAIEDVFYAVNVKSALKLGQVRGVAMLAASTSGLQVAEYSPLSIKSAVVGYGRADKFQVQQMVTRLLNLAAAPEPTDASDALAIAICHIHTAATNSRYQAAVKMKRGSVIFLWLLLSATLLVGQTLPVQKLEQNRRRRGPKFRRGSFDHI